MRVLAALIMLSTASRAFAQAAPASTPRLAIVRSYDGSSVGAGSYETPQLPLIRTYDPPETPLVRETSLPTIDVASNRLQLARAIDEDAGPIRVESAPPDAAAIPLLRLPLARTIDADMVPIRVDALPPQELPAIAIRR